MPDPQRASRVRFLALVREDPVSVSPSLPATASLRATKNSINPYMRLGIQTESGNCAKGVIRKGNEDTMPAMKESQAVVLMRSVAMVVTRGSLKSSDNQPCR